MNRDRISKILEDMAFESTQGLEITEFHIGRDYWIMIAHEINPYCNLYADGQPSSLFGIPVKYYPETKIAYGYSVKSYLTKEKTK